MRSNLSHTLGAASRGFTLVEALVGSALFLVISLAAYNAYIGLFRLIDLNHYRVLATSLANEQFELARNLPYSSVGVQGGIPNGVIPHVQTLTRGGYVFTVTTTVRNLDLPFDGVIGGTPNDSSPADNKLVEVSVSCDACKDGQPIGLTGQIAPKSLETSSSNGALFVRVFDANGQPIQGAAVHVENVATTTATISIDDVTDASGMLQLVDVPPDVNAYRIVVTKSGYSTDRTYPLGAPGNPSPAKPDATVIVQQVTQMSFSIDRLATLSVRSVTPQCVAIPSFDFTLTGSKLLSGGTPPAVYKYSQALTTDGAGARNLSSMEWDTYTIVPTDTGYDLAGLNPLNPVTVNPNASQELQLIAVPSSPRSLLVTVKDTTTQLPVSDAEVTLTVGGVDEEQTTGKGYINQTDWSGGGGQSTSSDMTMFADADAGIDTSTPGEIKLRQSFGEYVVGIPVTLESSTFDTGSISNFYSLVWSPADVPALAGAGAVRFQIATATTSSPASWEYLGPDGTSSTYYTVSDSPISAAHNGGRYLRYLAYLSTETATVTPIISDVAFTFTSQCTPPGQVIFTGLPAGTHHLMVTKPGYATAESDVSVSADWQETAVILAP